MIRITLISIVGVYVFALFVGAFNVDRGKAFRVLDGVGIERAVLEGYAVFGCGDDIFRSKWSGFRGDRELHGVVCCGMFKSCTVRYE